MAQHTVGRFRFAEGSAWGVLEREAVASPTGKEGSTNKRLREVFIMKTNKKTIVTGLVAALLLVMGVAGLAIAEDSIVGTIAEKGEVIVLDAADGTYVLEGSDLTPEMVGKKVKVTGTVAEKDNMKVISVLSMEEVTE
jgi:hypothetical protein